MRGFLLIFFLSVTAANAEQLSPLFSGQSNDLLQLQQAEQPLEPVLSTDGEFLPVEQAFVFAGFVPRRDQVILQWVVADGYYLYHDQFNFQSDAEQIVFADSVFPASETRTDEFYGTVAVYAEPLVEIVLPIDAVNSEEFSLSVRYQGCAEAGLCYLPVIQTLDLTLPQQENS